MRALVMSGGGSKIAFHVGVIRRLVGEERNHYPILAGVSAGSIVAASLAMFPEGSEAEAAEFIESRILPVSNPDIWKHWWPFGRVSALWKPSIYNSAPLRELLRRELDGQRIRDTGKHLRLGAVSLETGHYTIFEEDHIPIANAVLASSAFPGFFEPIQTSGEWFTDGGVQRVTPIKAAIEAGATEIDVVITDPEEITKGFVAEPKALDVLLRSLEAMTHRLAWVDVRYALAINELVRAGKAKPHQREIAIRIICPDSVLDGSPLDFDPERAKEWAELGYRAASAPI